MNAEEKLERSIENFNRFIFETTATDINAWLNLAITLRASATIIREHHLNNKSYLPAYTSKDHLASHSELIQFLLIGYSVENYAKGIFVAKNPKVVENDQLMHIDHHDVVSILKDAQFDIADTEKGFLEKLNKIVLWAGRYPIPNNLKHWLKDKKQKSLIRSAVSIKSSDFEIAHKLLDRLELKLKQILRSEEDSFKKTGIRIRVV